MKKFNKSIKVEVSVDSIAEQLLSTFNVEEKHRELITEAIIGSAITSEKVSYIYNALNGHSPEINFKVGETIKYEYNYRKEEDAEYEGHDVNCEIIDIDLYATDKVKIKFSYDSYEYGKQKVREFVGWVNHTECNKVPKVLGKINI